MTGLGFGGLQGCKVCWCIFEIGSYYMERIYKYICIYIYMHMCVHAPQLS